MKYCASIAFLAAAFALSGCAATDLVAKYANETFSAVASASGSRVVRSDSDSSWILSSPGGDELRLSQDFAGSSHDASLSLDASPFLAAGLDPSKLPTSGEVSYRIDGQRLVLDFDLGDAKFSSDAKESLTRTFAELVRTGRSHIGYHEKLDHYGIKLGGGNMFEWARDMASNDKDIVFVLDPAALIAAGVDPAAVTGWVFAKVEMKDDAGKTVIVDKLLRPFNLK